MINYHSKLPHPAKQSLVHIPDNQENFPPDRVIVDTRQGPVVGRLEEDYDVRFRRFVHWTSFTGLPFAAPPVGHLRFQPPQV